MHYQNRYTIVYNGEIYNYQELKNKLQNERQVNFVTFSDTEVVLEMYRNYQEKCLDYFIGMFAFAIYDKENSDLFRGNN